MSKSGDSEEHCTTFDVLFQPLEAFLARYERDHPPHHREKLHFREFVRTLVYHFAKGCESGRQLLTDTSTAEPELELGEVKHSTFFDAFQRFPVTWFASALSFLLVTVVWQAIPELDALGKLYCVDGSVFPAIASAGLMVAPERLAGARGNTFLATVGEKLHRYWKISKHWLVA